MKAKRCLILASMMVLGNLHGAYTFESDIFQQFESITVTPTNLMMKFRAGHMGVGDPDVKNRDFSIRFSRSYIENDETLVVPPDRRMDVWDKHVGYLFTPVIFKDKSKGFEITKRYGPPIVSKSTPVKINTFHVVLGDAPMDVGEDDVEMVMEAGREWVSATKSSYAIPPDYSLLADTPYPYSYTNSETYMAEREERRRFIGLHILPDLEESPPDESSPPVIASVPAKQPSPEPEPLPYDTATPSCGWVCWAVGGACAVLILAIGGTLYFRRKK